MLGAAPRQISITFDKPLVGLETIEAFVISPLPLLSLFAAVNRLFRFEFPPVRNEECLMNLVNKGIEHPKLSRQHLASLPMATIERLAMRVLSESTEVWLAAQTHQEVTTDFHALPSLQTLSDWQGWDIHLQFIKASEELTQFDAMAIAAEDLAILNLHPPQPENDVHAVTLKFSHDASKLKEILRVKGYRHDLMNPGLSGDAVLFHYWLARQVSFYPSWTAILTLYGSQQAVSYPFLNRFLKIWQELSGFLADARCTAITQHNIGELFNEVTAQLQGKIGAAVKEKGLPYPVKRLVLVEGATEAVLIPALASLLGCDPDTQGLMVQTVGGKSQMMQQYVRLSEVVTAPITMVLDRDAEPLLPDLNYYLKPADSVFILEEGEIEDAYPVSLILKTIQSAYPVNKALTLADLEARDDHNRSRLMMAKRLHQLWPQWGLGAFDKIGFVTQLVKTMQPDDWPETNSLRRLVGLLAQ